MSARTTLLVTLELLSDAVFGAGHSVPGGEMRAACLDRDGFPCLRGATFKGLLRESLQNWLVWTGGSSDDASAILGESCRSAADDGRRLHLTDLTLSERPANPESCFVSRVFTPLNRGEAAAGHPYAVRCVREGLRFTGTLECAQKDAELLTRALAALKWAGAMRSRGLGCVRVTAVERTAAAQTRALSPAHCIRYRLQSELPLLLTDLGRSRSNSCETLSRIPGAAVRGMVMGRLAAGDPAWFSAHKVALLSESTRFLDAEPLPPAGGPEAFLPAVCGFYERRDGSGLTHLFAGENTAGRKRSELGCCCAPEGSVLRYWSPETSGDMRIRRTDENGSMAIFQTRWLEAGQEFEGYIFLDDPELAPRLAQALNGTVWLGADRCEGFGKCAVTALETVSAPARESAYGCRDQREIQTELEMLALSPLCMPDRSGIPCGLDEETLARQLEVGTVRIGRCCTSVSEYGGYNRTWECRVPGMQMYDRGSLFRLCCSQPPTPEALAHIQRRGLGFRTAEGFGQVLFLRPGLLEEIREKKALRRDRSGASAAGRARRAHYAWIEAQSLELQKQPLSRTRLEELRTLCARAASSDSTAALLAFLDKNLHGRGPRNAALYTQADRIIRRALDGPLPQELGAAGLRDRLALLGELFEYTGLAGNAGGE